MTLCLNTLSSDSKIRLSNIKALLKKIVYKDKNSFKNQLLFKGKYVVDFFSHLKKYFQLLAYK